MKFANRDAQTKLAIDAVPWGFEGLVNGRANKLPRPFGAPRYLLARCSASRSFNLVGRRCTATNSNSEGKIMPPAWPKFSL